MPSTIQPFSLALFLQNGLFSQKSNYCMTDADLIETPLGTLLAIADKNGLYLVDFIDSPKIEKKVQQLLTHAYSSLQKNSNNPILQQIKQELDLYFAGSLTQFKTPLHFTGTPFANNVLQTVKAITYGQTKSYTDLAHTVGNPKACRAVAQANAANRLLIVVPCHRIITADHKLGGYSSGLERKP
jgi:AraC family transcriptional regulator of adaptative response/methylated-DNA-[protein]-cysteine methyltransferase